MEASHVNEMFRAARAAEIQIKVSYVLTRMHGLAPGLIRRIHLAVVQFIALYGVELLVEDQKTNEQTFQKLVNRQARSITGMYSSTPIHPLLGEAGLIPAKKSYLTLVKKVRISVTHLARSPLRSEHLTH